MISANNFKSDNRLVKQHQAYLRNTVSTTLVNDEFGVEDFRETNHGSTINHADIISDLYITTTSTLGVKF